MLLTEHCDISLDPDARDIVFFRLIDGATLSRHSQGTVGNVENNIHQFIKGKKFKTNLKPRQNCILKMTQYFFILILKP